VYQKDFMQLIANIIQYFLIIIGPIIAVVVMFSGAMVLWLNYQAIQQKNRRAKEKVYWYFDPSSSGDIYCYDCLGACCNYY
jgi:hypothetical protein